MVFSLGFLLRLWIESRWRFHQAIHMLRAPRWPNEEIQRLLSTSSDSKWAEHKELSVKSWMSSTGPLPKSSGLSTPFKATFPITFTQTVQTKTTEMWGEKLPYLFLWQMSAVGAQKDRDYLRVFHFKRRSMFWKAQSQEIWAKEERYHFMQGFEFQPGRTHWRNVAQQITGKRHYIPHKWRLKWVINVSTFFYHGKNWSRNYCHSEIASKVN